MPTPDEIRTRLRHYIDRLCAGDTDAIAGLYADDGWVEDPVGQPAHRGREAVRGFYAGTAGMLRAEIRGPVVVNGHTGVMTLLASLTLPGQSPRWLDAVDIVEFDDDGQIVSLRAYWNPMEMRDDAES